MSYISDMENIAKTILSGLKKPSISFNESLSQEDRDYITGFLAEPVPVPDGVPAEAGRVYAVRAETWDGSLWHGILLPVYATLLIQDEVGFWQNEGLVTKPSPYEKIKVLHHSVLPG